jgi:hypothetical protein
MNNMNKLSILIITHNRLEFTRFCLGAVGLYAEPDCIADIVIGDAQSTDGTERLVNDFQFGGIPKAVYTAPAGNVAKNLRMGAERAMGEYIFVVGNDILVAPNFSSLALSAIRQAIPHGINIVAYDDADYRLHFYGEPIALGNGITLKRSKNVGGLVIIPRKKMLEKGAGGYLGEINTKYEGWQIWYRLFDKELAMMFPRIGCFDMLRIATQPKGFEYIQYRRKEPIVQELLATDPIALERQYVAKKWSRNHPLDIL